MEIAIIKSNTMKKGNFVIEAGNDFAGDIKQLLSVIESINTAWEGADALKYINTMRDKYITGLNELSDTIKEYGQYLASVPEAYSLLDELFVNRNIDV